MIKNQISKVATIAAVAALTLTACGGSGSADEGKKSYTIGVSFYNEQLPVYVGIREGLEAAAKEKGIQLIFADAENNAATQTDQINNFVTRGVNAVIASPADAQALAPAYREAQAAQIPVFSVGNRLKDESVEAAYVGPDLQLEAEQTMTQLIAGIGGQGNIILMTGPPQSAFVQLQEAGWKTALAKAPGVKVVDKQVVADLSKASAVDIAQSSLTAHPDVAGIIASNDQVGLGVVQAMNAHGIKPSDVFVACWNTPKEVLTAVKEGQIDLTLTQRPQQWGKTALQTAVDWLEGTKPSEHRVKTPDLFVTTDNVAKLTGADLQ